ncbi:MAG: hypothetical protein AAGG80_04270, partial [Pseudomonadota bacterium]
GADLDSGHFLPSMAKNSGMTRTNWLFFDLRNNAFGKRGGMVPTMNYTTTLFEKMWEMDLK